MIIDELGSMAQHFAGYYAIAALVVGQAVRACSKCAHWREDSVWPTTKAKAYKRYRKACGRDARVLELWGDQAPFAKPDS